MKNITTYQENFIIEKFFKNENFAGWRNISEKLVQEQTVLTTCNHTDIWWGGVGNFITSYESDKGVGLWEYNFNLEGFLSSEWFKEVAIDEIQKAYLRQVTAKAEYDQLSNLVK